MGTPKQIKKFYICADVSHTHTHTHAHTHTYRHAYTNTRTFTHSTFTHDSITHIHPTFSHYCIHSFHAPPFDIFFCTHRSFTISFLSPAFPIQSSHFFGCLLEEVDAWGQRRIAVSLSQGYTHKVHGTLPPAFSDTRSSERIPAALHRTVVLALLHL